MRVLLLVLVVAASTFIQPRAAHAQPTSLQLTECPANPSWYSPREELSGTFLVNGWDFSFIELWSLTAIGGQLQGSLATASVDDNWQLETDSLSLTGIYDEHSISVTINAIFSTLTLSGTWDSSGVSLSGFDSDGEMFETTLRPADPQMAQNIFQLWQDKEIRVAGQQAAVAALQSVFAEPAYVTDLTDTPRVLDNSQSSAAMHMPRGDSLELLVRGWLASGSYMDRAIGNAPNATSWYQLTYTRGVVDSYQLASCARNFMLTNRSEQQEVDGYDVDLILTSTFVGSEPQYTTTYFLVISGNVLVTVQVVGTQSVRDTALDTALAMVNTATEQWYSS